jgi:hypothetical protein
MFPLEHAEIRLTNIKATALLRERIKRDNPQGHES